MSERPTARGLFVTLEGGEGAGKSTHARRLCARLRAEGVAVVQTREPGGSPEAEAIRALLVTGEVNRWSANAEVLLNYAARDQHLAMTIRPALADGQWVVSDRFSDSTRAYQGAGGGADMALIEHLERVVVGDTRPDLTIVFDLDPDLGLKRAGKREEGRDEHRFERKGLAFHKRLRAAFLEIAEADAARCVVVDATAPVDEVAEAVWQAVASRLLA